MSWYLATNQIRRLQIELTNYCNAACPLCDRENLTKEELNNTAISFEKIRSIITNDDWSDLNQIHLCGNYDEPTIHPDCMDIVKWLIENQFWSIFQELIFDDFCQFGAIFIDFHQFFNCQD